MSSPSPLGNQDGSPAQVIQMVKGLSEKSTTLPDSPMGGSCPGTATGVDDSAQALSLKCVVASEYPSETRASNHEVTSQLFSQVITAVTPSASDVIRHELQSLDIGLPESVVDKVAQTYTGMVPMERFLLETCGRSGPSLEAGRSSGTSTGGLPVNGISAEKTNEGMVTDRAAPHEQG
ncbi:uncharacterized protein DNG_10106 [Cephalotrichum gorgonifer]|uniref:Uncharacterized protein n=1 Tax=Cephalotrichum gorgonifer TaxID=2041049 RepID=A0AAE8T0I4_9PEZI|nr:uncharacterized protein DNG_10106 [Cephalotrichum gorgonifer]